MADIRSISTAEFILPCVRGRVRCLPAQFDAQRRDRRQVTQDLIHSRVRVLRDGIKRQRLPVPDLNRT